VTKTRGEGKTGRASWAGVTRGIRPRPTAVGRSIKGKGKELECHLSMLPASGLGARDQAEGEKTTKNREKRQKENNARVKEGPLA